VGLDPARPEVLEEQVAALARLGVARSVVGMRYADAGEFARGVERIAARVLPALGRG
jgi:hypothetical protein